VALAPLARRATGCAGRFAWHAVQRSASRVSESSARPQVRVKGARLQNGAQPEEQKRVLPLRGSGRNCTGRGWSAIVDFCNSEIVAFDDFSCRFQ
jgi:hypothetical protein